MSLKKQAVSGMVWTFSQQFGAQLITFAISVILARLLLPSDFGTIAMFSVVMSIATSFVNGGMSSSLIRHSAADESDYSTVFWFNVGVAIVIYVIIYLIAPFIAEFYKVEVLTPVIRVYCLSIIIGSFSTVQRTRLVKNMNFKTLFNIQLPSLLIGGISGVFMAHNGFGIWTLVYYPLIQAIISGIQVWLYSKWRPQLIFDLKKFKYHFNYGYKMTLSSLLDTVFSNIYTIIIGKMFSPVQLGFYNRADNLKQLPISNLAAALNKVTFPLFAQIQHDHEKLKVVYRKVMKTVIFVIAPVLCLMIVTAEPMIRILLGIKWLPVVPYFQVLAVAGILYPIHAYNLNILTVTGRSDLFLRLEFFKKILQVLTLLASVSFGVMGIVWGQVVFSLLAFFINTHYTGKILKYGSLKQLIDLMPILLLSAATALLIHLLDLFLFNSLQDFPRLFVLSFIYVGFYLGVVWLLKLEEFNYIKELIKK